jgi:hypothetical protein
LDGFWARISNLDVRSLALSASRASESPALLSGDQALRAKDFEGLGKDQNRVRDERNGGFRRRLVVNWNICSSKEGRAVPVVIDLNGMHDDVIKRFREEVGSAGLGEVGNVEEGAGVRDLGRCLGTGDEERVEGVGKEARCGGLKGDILEGVVDVEAILAERRSIEGRRRAGLSTSEERGVGREEEAAKEGPGNGVSGRGVGCALEASQTQGALKKECLEESGWIDGQADGRLTDGRSGGSHWKGGEDSRASEGDYSLKGGLEGGLEGDQNSRGGLGGGQRLEGGFEEGQESEGGLGKNGGRAPDGNDESEARLKTEGLTRLVLAKSRDTSFGGEPVLTYGGALAGDSGVGLSGRLREGSNDGEGFNDVLRDGFSSGTESELDKKSGYGDGDGAEVQAGRSDGFENGVSNLFKDEVRVRYKPGSGLGNDLSVPHLCPLEEAAEAEETQKRNRVSEYSDTPSLNVHGGQKPWEVTPFQYVTERLLPPSLEMHGAAYQVGCSCSGDRCEAQHCDHVAMFDHDNPGVRDVDGRLIEGRAPYDAEGRLLLPVSAFIADTVVFVPRCFLLRRSFEALCGWETLNNKIFKVH